MTITKFNNVLISVSNKTNLDILGAFLFDQGCRIFSTGGTYKYLNQLPHKSGQLVSVEEYTKYPEILDGRVKTLHPKIYGGLLSTNKQSHLDECAKHDIVEFDLVVVNLYPFEKYFNTGKSEEEMIELIDIGGVSLLRASGKNYRKVISVCDPGDYYSLMERYSNSYVDQNFRREMGLKSFQHVTHYDQVITKYFQQLSTGDTDPELSVESVKGHELNLKYGLNPHQGDAKLIWNISEPNPFRIVNGKPGYINLLDAICSWMLVSEIEHVWKVPGVASFKHTSPAGVATGFRLLSDLEKEVHNYTASENTSFLASAFVRARGGDPLSSFGDFIALNRVVDVETATAISKEVSDGLIAPGFEPEAMNILMKKRKGTYLILEGNVDYLKWYLERNQSEYREVCGLTLSQKPSRVISDKTLIQNSTIPTKNQVVPDSAIIDLTLANMSMKYAQSNNICYAYDGQVIGLAAGQQNRVDSVTLAGKKAKRWFARRSPAVARLRKNIRSSYQNDDGETIKISRQDKVNVIMDAIKNLEDGFLNSSGPEREDYLKKFKPEGKEDEYFLSKWAVDEFLAINMENVSMASDAFFPFRDNIYRAHEYGVKYILQPGGSFGDQSCLEACNKHDMVMLCSGQRMFYH